MTLHSSTALPAEQRLTYFAYAVVNLCAKFNASVTSWYRSSKQNADVGGDTASYHLEGLAADLLPDKKRDLAALVDAAHALQLDAVNEGDHVHVELDYRRNRKDG